MTQDEARMMVAEAVDLRKRWGKHSSIADLPPEFLDAVVIEVERLKGAAAAAIEASTAASVIEAQREQLVLANRQLGAAKARETKLRNELAEMQKELNRAGNP